MTTTPSTAGKAGDVESQPKCPICGETAPEPAWLCLPRLMGEAPINKPCSYSVEGDARGNERLRVAGEALAATIRERALIARTETDGGRNAE